MQAGLTKAPSMVLTLLYTLPSVWDEKIGLEAFSFLLVVVFMAGD